MRLTFAILLLSASLVSHAQEQDLDAVLDGFDKAPPSGEALDDVMQGFDDAAPGSGGELEEALSGFDSEKPKVETEFASTSSGPLDIGGALQFSTTWNSERDAPASGATDYRGWSRARLKLNLEADLDISQNWDARLTGYLWHDAIFAFKGRAEYSDRVVDAMEQDADLGEAWLRGRVSDQIDVKLGKQLVVWGKSDNLRVTDILNPADNREPGMVDIEDARIPLAMSRLDYYYGDWNLTALAIHEIDFHKLPEQGSDFYPFASTLPAERQISDGGDNTEYAAAANGIFSGWDLSFYWAQVYNDDAHLTTKNATTVRDHARITMLGSAINIAVDNWLLKGELAHLSGLQASMVGDDYARSDLLLGAEYAGFSDSMVSLEVVDRHIADYTQALEQAGVKEDAIQYALRYQRDAMHDRLHLTLLDLRNGHDMSDGGFTRFSIEYELEDALAVTGGYIAYHDGETIPFSGIEDNDRLFAEIDYSF